MEKTKTENLVFDGKLLKFYNDEVTLENGDTSKREYVKHPGGVCCLAIKNGMIYFEKQFRYPFRNEILELPAGKIEKNEDPKDAIIRELEEEIGFIPKTIEFIDYMYPSVGYTNEIIYLYFSPINDETESHLEIDEFLSVKPIPIKEAYSMLDKNEIHDAKTVYLMLKLRQRIFDEYI